jgi:hypothetical protein
VAHFGAILTAVAVLALAAILASAQPFRAGVTLAVLDVVVTAPDGESIPDLKAADFDVKDNGVSRDVVSSVFVQIPVEMARTPSTDVWTNGQERRSRVFSFVIDDLDIPAASVGRVVAQVRRLISVIPDGDKVSLVYCGRQAGAQDFTADKARLIESLQGLSGRPTTMSQRRVLKSNITPPVCSRR